MGPNPDRSSTLLQAAHGQAGMGRHGPRPTGPSMPTGLAEPLSISINFAIRPLDIYIFICLKNIQFCLFILEVLDYSVLTPRLDKTLQYIAFIIDVINACFKLCV